MELWQVDLDLFREIHVGLRRGWLDPWMVGLSESGLGYAQLLALLTVALWGRSPPWASLGLVTVTIAVPALVERDPKSGVASAVILALVWPLKEAGARLAFWTVVGGGIARLAVVEFVGRERPGNLGFATPLEDVFGRSSFPSGHATTTAAIAGVALWLAALGHVRWGAAWLLLSWLALVSLSRVYVGVHYPLDVVAGTAFGFLAATVATLFTWKRLADRSGRPYVSSTQSESGQR